MLSLQQLNQQTGFLPCCDCELFFVNLAICICHNYESIVGNTTLLLFMQLSVLLQELYELQQLQAILKCLKCDSCKLFCWIYNRFLNSSELLLTFFVVARQTAIVKQTIHCCYFYKMILLFWQQWLKIGTTLFLMIPITCIVTFAKWIVCCQSSHSFWPFYKIILFSLQKWLKFGMLVEWCQLMNWHKSFEVCLILIIILYLMIINI